MKPVHWVIQTNLLNDTQVNAIWYAAIEAGCEVHPAIVIPFQDELGNESEIPEYDENERIVLAIHRVWEGNPRERRRQRLQSSNPSDRVAVTNGCINVTEEVYDLLYDCCSNGKLTIQE